MIYSVSDTLPAVPTFSIVKTSGRKDSYASKATNTLQLDILKKFISIIGLLLYIQTPNLNK